MSSDREVELQARVEELVQENTHLKTTLSKFKTKYVECKRRLGEEPSLMSGVEEIQEEMDADSSSNVSSNVSGGIPEAERRSLRPRKTPSTTWSLSATSPTQKKRKRGGQRKATNKTCHGKKKKTEEAQEQEEMTTSENEDNTVPDRQLTSTPKAGGRVQPRDIFHMSLEGPGEMPSFSSSSSSSSSSSNSSSLFSSTLSFTENEYEATTIVDPTPDDEDLLAASQVALPDEDAVETACQTDGQADLVKYLQDQLKEKDEEIKRLKEDRDHYKAEYERVKEDNETMKACEGVKNIKDEKVQEHVRKATRQLEKVMDLFKPSSSQDDNRTRSLDSILNMSGLESTC